MAPSRRAYIVDGRAHFKKNRELWLEGRAALSRSLAQASLVYSSAMSDLFAICDAAEVTVDFIDEHSTVLLIDNIFRNPHAIRDAALKLDFSPGTANYPGRVARFPPGDQSLLAFLRNIGSLVQSNYLPHLPALPNGRKLTQLRGLDTDFAITDLHPDHLSPTQRKPHIDAAPVFGLIYLNDPPRGGTMFYRQRKKEDQLLPAHGYPTAKSDQVELCYRVEGLFNRLAIYPGFVLHSGEIEGDWIKGEERFRNPRLTQRIQFFL